MSSGRLRQWQRAKAAYDFAIARLATPPVDRTGQGTSRGKIEYGFIIPFSRKIGANGVIRVPITTAAKDKMSAALGANIKFTPAGTDIQVSPRRFKPAKIVMNDGRSAAGVTKTSEKTGLKYLSYGGTSYTGPFGKPTEASTDTMYDIYADIRAILDDTANRTFTLVDEVAGT